MFDNKQTSNNNTSVNAQQPTRVFCNFCGAEMVRLGSVSSYICTKCGGRLIIEQREKTYWPEYSDTHEGYLHKGKGYTLTEATKLIWSKVPVETKE